MNRYSLAAFVSLCIVLIYLLTVDTPPAPVPPKAESKPKPESNVSEDHPTQRERNAKYSK
jgi:hypothetical protein